MPTDNSPSAGPEDEADNGESDYAGDSPEQPGAPGADPDAAPKHAETPPAEG